MVTRVESTLAAVFIASAVFYSSVAVAAPTEPTGTLRKIADSGTIAIGFHEATFPFTYVTDEGQILGYSYDFALKIVDAVKRELALPKLQIKHVVTTTQNRFSTIQNGAADIQCGATTNTLERQKIAAFSNTIFIAGSRLMTRRSSGINDFTDIAGKTVVTFARSTSERILQKMNNEQNARINIVSTFDRGDTPLSVMQAGQADAYMMDDVLLFAAIRASWRPDEWVVTGKPRSFEAYGCILRKDDPAFKAVVDREIARIMRSGEAEVIFRKWLMSPTPPKGINLNLPLSDQMVELFKNPNDKPFD